ncbi:transcription termination/antitermination protein NusG [Seohaeicola nanhaiensis]|uniref:Transcription termination/antitermination protein NusG n=1 Tax=Seohaeicola nanhaiensis TaxID=1387282 RepID=A0ABV9KE06_9RHOB
MMAKLPAAKAFDADLVSDLEARYCNGPDTGNRVIFRPSVMRWYALRVPPQREDQAEAWLKRRGVYAFHPVLKRRVVRYGVEEVRKTRYLPGYVFARFPGDPVEHLVVTSPFVIGALCSDTVYGIRWGVVKPTDLRALHAMRSLDEAAEAARRCNPLLRIGGGAMFDAGMFEGQQGRVEELNAHGGAKVKLHLFGHEIVVEAEQTSLTAVQKTP